MTDTGRTSRVAAAAINLALGICTGSLIGMVMLRTVRRTRERLG